MKRSDFQQSGNEYFCDTCQKQVFDLTECTLEDVITLQRERGTICGIVRVIGAASLLSFSSCAGTMAAPEKLVDPSMIGTIPMSSVVDGSEQNTAGQPAPALGLDDLPNP